MKSARTPLPGRRRSDRLLPHPAEELLDALAEDAPALLFLAAPDEALTWISGQWSELLGLPESELLGSGWTRALHPDDEQAALARYRAAFRTRAPLRLECRLLARDGAYRSFLCQAKPRSSEDGEFLGMAGLFVDVSERQSAELEVRRTRDLLQTLIDTMPAMVSLVDAEQRYVFVNSHYEEWFGRPPSDFVGRALWEMNDATTYARMRPRVLQALAGEPVHFSIDRTDLAGRNRHMDVRYVPRLEDGRVSGFLVMVFDDTERCAAEAGLHRALDELLASEQRERDLRLLALREQGRMAALLSAMSPGILFTDAQQRVEYLNPAFLRIWGLAEGDSLTGSPANEALARSPRRLAHSTAPHALPSLPTLLTEIEPAEIELDSGRVLTQVSHAVRDPEGNVLGRLWIYEDVTRERQSARQLLNLAERDALTKLFNRHRFNEQLEKSVALAQRGGSRIALAYFDLDEFKAINDTYGHRAGDQVLVRTAAEVATLIRSSDMLARVGGDEFVVLAHLRPEDDVSVLAQRIVDAIAGLPLRVGDQSLRLTTSVGVAVYPQHGESAAELLAHADAAMYQAKDRGKNAWALFEPGPSSAARGTRLPASRHARDTLEQERLELHFQGIYETATRKLSHLEVLARLRDPDVPGRLILPGQFVPMAEKTGQIVEIDRWVIRRVIQLLGHRPELPPLAVNVSGRSFDDPLLPRFIRGLLAEHRVEPGRLILELTETAAVTDVTEAQRFIEAMHEAGCRVCLDDFGSGFSTFAYLKYLGVEILKIDGLFIRDLHANVENQVFVKAMVEVARGLGKTTVAEFVEDAATFAKVRELGVALAQGFYLDRPAADHPAVTR